MFHTQPRGWGEPKAPILANTATPCDRVKALSHNEWSDLGWWDGVIDLHYDCEFESESGLVECSRFVLRFWWPFIMSRNCFPDIGVCGVWDGWRVMLCYTFGPTGPTPSTPNLTKHRDPRDGKKAQGQSEWSGWGGWDGVVDPKRGTQQCSAVEKVLNYLILGLNNASNPCPLNTGLGSSKLPAETLCCFCKGVPSYQIAAADIAEISAKK